MTPVVEILSGIQNGLDSGHRDFSLTIIGEQTIDFLLNVISSEPVI